MLAVRAQRLYGAAGHVRVERARSFAAEAALVPPRSSSSAVVTGAPTRRCPCSRLGPVPTQPKPPTGNTPATVEELLSPSRIAWTFASRELSPAAKPPATC